MLTKKATTLLLTITLALLSIGTVIFSLSSAKHVSADGQPVTYVYLSGPTQATPGQVVTYQVDVNQDASFPVHFHYGWHSGNIIIETWSQIISSTSTSFQIEIPSWANGPYEVRAQAEAVHAPGWQYATTITMTVGPEPELIEVLAENPYQAGVGITETHVLTLSQRGDASYFSFAATLEDYDGFPEGIYLWTEDENCNGLVITQFICGFNGIPKVSVNEGTDELQDSNIYTITFHTYSERIGTFPVNWNWQDDNGNSDSGNFELEFNHETILIFIPLMKNNAP